MLKGTISAIHKALDRRPQGDGTEPGARADLFIPNTAHVVRCAECGTHYDLFARRGIPAVNSADHFDFCSAREIRARRWFHHADRETRREGPYVVAEFVKLDRKPVPPRQFPRMSRFRPSPVCRAESPAVAS